MGPKIANPGIAPLLGASEAPHAETQPTPFAAIGQSKGALAIGNALRTLDAEKTTGLKIVTLGCPIAEELEGATYHQFLGLFDGLEQLNMWGHQPSAWLPTWHSTNRLLPPAMEAGDLSRG